VANNSSKDKAQNFVFSQIIVISANNEDFLIFLLYEITQKKCNEPLIISVIGKYILLLLLIIYWFYKVSLAAIISCVVKETLDMSHKPMLINIPSLPS
jgi:hypothetical protein